MKKKILIICFIIIGVVLLTFSYINRNIGIVSGAENEYILIDKNITKTPIKSKKNNLKK